MSSYTITITPDDASLASTTLRVDVSENVPRITELMVRAGAAAGLSPNQLPAVDLEMLMRAVSPSAFQSIPSQVAETLPATESPVAEAASPQPPAATGTRRRRSMAQNEPKTGKRGGRAAGSEQPAKGKRATKSATKSTGERAYRRAPDDLVEVFDRLGGVTAVARHYQVPRYTVQSWIRRLRREGQVPAGR